MTSKTPNSPAQTTATVMLFHKSIPVDQATALLRLHHAAFSQSACTVCPGLCCKDCAHEVGYLERDGADPATIEDFKHHYGFDAKNGFKAPSGCKLPLRLRSTTCAAFHCSTSAPHNSFARNVLKARNAQIATAAARDSQEVLQKIEALHSAMMAVYD